MAIMGSNRASDDINSGISAEDNYYNQAQGYMNPYTENAGQDFDAGRSALYKGAQYRMGQAPGYNQQYFGMTLGKTPDQILNEAMQGYSMSPMAQQQMQYSMSGANNAMASQGMYGSGDNAVEDAEIGNMISTKDMNNYLQAKGKAYGLEGSSLDKYNKQNQDLINMFRDMLQTEFKGSSKMAEIAQRVGQNEGNIYQRESQGEHQFQPLNQAASLGGLGYGLYKSGSGGSSASSLEKVGAKAGKDAMMAAMFM